MATAVNINEFLSLAQSHPVIDVRTPDEFNQGHIVGAVNLPLFTNEERKIIGTIYKQKGKQPAVLEALGMVGPKLQDYVKQGILLNRTNTFLVHCWRGGMRSSSMAWFLETYGFKCIVLKGGYKTYRKKVLDSFSEQKNIVVLGGRTGSGKTIILNELQKQGEQIIDLENLAHHKGSSFGSLGEVAQHSQEQFENELSFQLSKINAERKCWVENESRKIGRNILPEGFWNQMQEAMVVSVSLPKEIRLDYLVTEYGVFTKPELTDAVNRIAKRLGGVQTKRAVEAIELGDFKTAFDICLFYYDKTYGFGEERRPKEKLRIYEFSELNAEHIAATIKQYK